MYVYKYFSNVEYAINLIEKELLFLNSPLEFNDIYDSMLFFDLNDFNDIEEQIEVDSLKKLIYEYTPCVIKEEIKLLLNEYVPNNSSKRLIQYIEGKIDGEHFTYIKKNIIKVIQRIKISNYKVSCFSLSGNSELMWSHYANHMKGVCLRFKIRESSVLNDLKKVVYSKKRLPFTKSNHLDSLLYKSDSWKYEKEERFIVEETDENLKVEEVSEKDKIVKHYYYPIEKPNAIIYGCRTSLPDILDLSICATNNKINIYKAEPDLHEFKINIMKINNRIGKNKKCPK